MDKYFFDLGRVLYEKLEHLDPSDEFIPWESLPAFDKEVYALCSKAILEQIRRNDSSSGISPQII